MVSITRSPCPSNPNKPISALRPLPMLACCSVESVGTGLPPSALGKRAANSVSAGTAVTVRLSPRCSQPQDQFIGEHRELILIAKNSIEAIARCAHHFDADGFIPGGRAEIGGDQHLHAVAERNGGGRHLGECNLDQARNRSGEHRGANPTPAHDPVSRVLTYGAYGNLLYSKRAARVRRIASGKQSEHQHAWRGQIAATAIARKSPGNALHQDSRQHPNLPVRKPAGDSELARDAHVGGQPPESQHICHQRSGREQRSHSGCDVPVLSGRALKRDDPAET